MDIVVHAMTVAANCNYTIFVKKAYNLYCKEKSEHPKFNRVKLLAKFSLRVPDFYRDWAMKKATQIGSAKKMAKYIVRIKDQVKQREEDTKKELSQSSPPSPPPSKFLKLKPKSESEDEEEDTTVAEQVQSCSLQSRDKAKVHTIKWKYISTIREDFTDKNEEVCDMLNSDWYELKSQCPDIMEGDVVCVDIEDRWYSAGVWFYTGKNVSPFCLPIFDEEDIPELVKIYPNLGKINKCIYSSRGSVPPFFPVLEAPHFFPVNYYFDDDFHNITSMGKEADNTFPFDLGINWVRFSWGELNEIQENLHILDANRNLFSKFKRVINGDTKTIYIFFWNDVGDHANGTHIKWQPNVLIPFNPCIKYEMIKSYEDFILAPVSNHIEDDICETNTLFHQLTDEEFVVCGK